MTKPDPKPLYIWLMLIFAITLITGCDHHNEYVPPPPPKVIVSRPVKRDITEYLQSTGTTRAAEKVEIRARLAGFLESSHFEPGTQVEKDSLLYVIDQKPFKATLQEAQAGLASAKARVERAQIEFDRARRLFKKGAGSEVDLVKWHGDLKIAQADVEAAQATIEKARLDLRYTEVRAPITGRIGRNLVDVGNLVGAGEFTLLTTMEQYDPMHVYFSVNEREVLRFIETYRRRSLEKINPVQVEAQPRRIDLGLPTEPGFPHTGWVDWSDLGVDPTTGTLLVRGVIPNPAPHALIPGLFVRVRIPVAEKTGALMVTERALGADQNGRYLLIVNEQNVVEQRSVLVGDVYEGMRIIQDGLKEDEWIIVSGIQRANPGDKVVPERLQNGPPSSLSMAGGETGSTIEKNEKQ